MAPTHAEAAPGTGPAKDTRIHTLATAILYRSSANQRPPWSAVEVTNVFGFKSLLKAGERVTVLPAEVAGAPFELSIAGTKKRDEEPPEWWEIELSAVTDRRYLDMAPPPGNGAAFLGKVAVVYPAIPEARLLQPSSIAPSELPAGLSREVIALAVDSTGDGRPDGLEAEFCCENERKPAASSQCDYTCSRTFLRRRGQWMQTDFSEPL